MKPGLSLLSLTASFLPRLYAVMPSIAPGATLSVWVLTACLRLAKAALSTRSCTGSVRESIPSTKRGRPIGVTILALLEVVTGAIFLLGGGALLTFAGGGSLTLYVFGTIHLPIGFLFLILGSLTAFYARGWVWALGLAVVIASIVDDFAAFALAPLPFDGVIGTTVVLFTALGAVYFLARADVRSFFEV